MTPSLSLTFEPPSTTAYGRSGSSVSRVSTSHLGGDQPTGERGAQRGDVVDAGLLAVDDAEAVADEEVAERGVLARRAQRVRRRPCWSPGRRTARSPAAATLPGASVVDGRAGPLGPEDAATNADGSAEQLTEPLGDRRQRQLRAHLALGAPQVGGTTTRAPALDEPLDGRDTGPDPSVVGDPCRHPSAR